MVTEAAKAYCRLANRLEAKLKRTQLAGTSAGRFLVDLILYPSDVLKIVGTYKAVFGTTPNLLWPRTFNEKLQQAKLINRRKQHTQYADKVGVRDYVARTIGPQYLNEMYWVGTDLAEAKGLDLPRRFVIKVNNGSGTTIVVRDSTEFDWDVACRTTCDWLATDHSVHFAEWQYRWIRPQLLIEAFLGDKATGDLPEDYKLFVFGGRVEMIQVNIYRETDIVKTFYDREFRLLPLWHKGYPRREGELPNPEVLEEMIPLAEKLAGQERFVRVDLYYVGRPVFGEITLHPWAGIGVWEPPEWDRRLGALMP